MHTSLRIAFISLDTDAELKTAELKLSNCNSTVRGKETRGQLSRESFLSISRKRVTECEPPKVEEGGVGGETAEPLGEVAPTNNDSAQTEVGQVKGKNKEIKKE